MCYFRFFIVLVIRNQAIFVCVSPLRNITSFTPLVVLLKKTRVLLMDVIESAKPQNSPNYFTIIGFYSRV